MNDDITMITLPLHPAGAESVGTGKTIFDDYMGLVTSRIGWWSCFTL